MLRWQDRCQFHSGLVIDQIMHNDAIDDAFRVDPSAF
jgi:hypothetical protein